MTQTTDLTPEGPQEAPQTPQKREVEPRVMTADVRAVLERVIHTGIEDSGDSVALIAEKADTSTRTVYRVLAEYTESIGLDLADRLCLAADTHLVECRLQWPDGEITGYVTGRFIEE